MKNLHTGVVGIGLLLGFLALGVPPANADSRAVIVWTEASATADGVSVERKTADGAFSQIADVAPTMNTWIDEGLSDAGVQYCYRVRAYNRGGSSAYSNEICVQTTSVSLPSLPAPPVLSTVVTP